MISHQFPRLLQLDKIRHPRDFIGLSEPFWEKQNIVLEIGAGKGKHAVLYATKYPNDTLIAIERTTEKFSAMQKIADQMQLSNLTIIHADAIAWMVHAVPKNSLSKIFILYPNPEPHNSNQRWLNMPFFEFLVSRLKTEGHIILASNVESYIDEAEKMAKEVWHLPVYKSQVAANSQRTHFEIKYLARGENCWELNIKKPYGYTTRFDD